MNLIIFRQFVILPYSPDSCLSLTHLWQLHGLGSHWNLWPLLQTCLTQGAFLIQGSPPRSPFLLLITHSGTYSIKPYLRLLPKNVFLSNRTTDLVSGIPVRSSRVKHVVGSLNKYLLNKWYVHVYPFVWSLQLGSKFQKDKLYCLFSGSPRQLAECEIRIQYMLFLHLDWISLAPLQRKAGKEGSQFSPFHRVIPEG